MKETKIIKECEFFGYDVYKQIFSIPILVNGEKVIIEKCHFYTNMNWKGCCGIKINGKWHAETRDKILKHLKQYNANKRTVN